MTKILVGLEMNSKKEADITRETQAIKEGSLIHQASLELKSTSDKQTIDGPYAKYVLVVLMLVYMFNVIDRQIFFILIEAIKSDLDLSDSDIGFLGGAAYAVFYAIFALPLARLADIWNRKKLIAIGLGFWSLMTALSGTAHGLLSLAAFRFGVGVGEASSGPASYSTLYDYFSPKVRATVVGFYAAGVYIGAGLGLFLGGMLLDGWNNVFPDSTLAPFGLKGWQATFMIIGLPGILMAFWVSTLREPVRGQSDGIISKSHPHPFRESAMVLMSLLPLTNLWVLVQEGGGKQAIIRNLLAGLGLALITYGLTQITGSILQWVVLGIGFYAVVSWAQSMALRDAVAFGMVFKCKALMYTMLAGVGPSFMGVGIGLWSVPYFQRSFGVSAADVGSALGLGYVLMGLPGVILGGVLADKLRRYSPRGKLYVLLVCYSLSILAALIFLTADNLILAYTGAYLMFFAGALGFGPSASTINDLVLPRNRAMTMAFSALVLTLGSAGLAPYVVGQISDAVAATGVDSGEALRQGMLWSLLVAATGIAFTILAIRHIEVDETSLKERAQALGEEDSV